MRRSIARQVWWLFSLWIVLQMLGCASVGGAGPHRAQGELGGSAHAAGSSATLPVTPRPGIVGRALQAVAPQVSECSGGMHAIVQVTVYFRRSGEVTSVLLPGELASSPLGACIAGHVRQTRLPPFQRATFSVSYPYRLD